MATLILRRSISAAAAARSSPITIERVRRISSSSSSSSAPGPWLMIEDGGKRFNNFYSSRSDDQVDDQVTQYYNFYSLADNQVITLDKKRGKDGTVVGSSHGWLALYKRRRDLYTWRRQGIRKGFDMFLYDPLSRRHVSLPPLETLRINKNNKKEMKTNILPKKVILSSSPDQPEGDTCRAIMSFGWDNRLACCYPGLSKEWTLVSGGTHEEGPINDQFGYSKFETMVPRVYEDFVYSKTRNQLFCTTKHDNFECWDMRDPLSPKMNWKIGDDDVDYDVENYPMCPRSNREKAMMKKGLCVSRKYLVFAERSNRLFLVRRNVMKEIGPIGFDVHEIIVDGEKKELRYMDGTLDGMAFFVSSIGDGFVVEETDEMMKKNNNVEPNSIYFTDSRKLDQGPWGIHGVGSFNYENRTFSRCPCDIRTNPILTWFTDASSSSH